jgi:hypothetical protein
MEDPETFAADWCAAWNAHDLEAILAHFTDDVIFTSPAAQRVLGGDGVVRGKEALREYWGKGLPLIPDLHFEVVGVYAGVETIVINYRNQVGNLVCEVLRFDGDLVREGHGTYLGSADVGGAIGATR